jgi:hypothetical protein
VVGGMLPGTLAASDQMIVAGAKSDFDKKVTGGGNDKTVSVCKNPTLCLRSGQPTATVQDAVIMTPLDNPSQIQLVTFSYEYISGYSKGKKPSTFEIWVQDETGKDAAGPLYTSPPLGLYSYDKCNKCYAPSTDVTVNCPGAPGCAALKTLQNTPHYFTIRFTNNDRNVQLKLPLTFVIGHEVGRDFVLLLFAAVGCYFAGGFGYGNLVKKKRGAAALPQAAFWASVGGLVRDGVDFSRAQLTGKARRPEVAREPKEPLRPTRPSDAASTHSRSSKRSTRSSSKKAKESKDARAARKASRASNSSRQSVKSTKSAGALTPPPAEDGVAGFSGALHEERNQQVHPSMAPIKIVAS